MSNHKFNEESLDILSKCPVGLQEVMKEAVKKTPYDFDIKGVSEKTIQIDVFFNKHKELVIAGVILSCAYDVGVLIKWNMQEASKFELVSS